MSEYRAERFTNELGSEVQISVLAEATEVTVLMRGPVSDYVAIITRMEARKLRDLLSATLTLKDQP